MIFYWKLALVTSYGLIFYNIASMALYLLSTDMKGALFTLVAVSVCIPILEVMERYYIRAQFLALDKR
jgi:hypothetical protein